MISTLLANVYLHYCFDLWAERWRRQEAQGEMFIVRYADDLALGFEREGDARRFLDAVREGLAAFALSLHPEKTRLIEFGRFAASGRRQRGLGKPETFDFLGFSQICGTSRQGRFLLVRKTRRDRMRDKLRTVKEELRRRMHQPIPEQGAWLRSVVTGHLGYYAVPTNFRALSAFRHWVTVRFGVAYCAQQTGLLTRGMTLRVIQSSGEDAIVEPDWMAPFLAGLARDDLAPAPLRGYRYDLRHFMVWHRTVPCRGGCARCRSGR